MATISTLISTLRDNADIAASEFGDTRIQEWLTAALGQHNRRHTLASLPPNEVDCVIMLAWIKVCYARASAATKFFSISGDGGSVNKAEVVSNNISLVTTLREEYISLCSRMGISPGPEVVVSEFTKFDESANKMTPTHAHESPEALNLVATNNTGTTVDLSWNETPNRNTFLRYRLFYGTSPNLQDMTTLGDENALYYGIDASKATLLHTYDESWRTSTRVNALEEGTTYYFVIMMEDVNGRFSVSNEVEVGENIAARLDTSLMYATFVLSGELIPNTEYIQSVTFPDKILIEQFNVQLEVAPSTEPCIIAVHDAEGGAGQDLTLTLDVDEYTGSITAETMQVDNLTGIYIRTGATVGGAASATVTIAYRVADKGAVLYGDDGDSQYYVTVEGTPPNEHVVILRYENTTPPNLEEYCYVTNDAGVRFRLSVTNENPPTVLIEQES